MSRRNNWNADTLRALSNVSEHNARALASVQVETRHKHGAKAVYACSLCWAAVSKHDREYAKCGCNDDDREWVYFDSTGEHQRWCKLLQFQDAGYIENLTRQFPISIIINGATVGHYVCDFFYFVRQRHAHIVGITVPHAHNRPSIVNIYEDYKGFDNPLSKFKRKCVEASNNITITLTRGSSNGRRPTKQHSQTGGKEENKAQGR